MHRGTILSGPLAGLLEGAPGEGIGDEGKQTQELGTVNHEEGRMPSPSPRPDASNPPTSAMKALARPSDHV